MHPLEVFWTPCHQFWTRKYPLFFVEVLSFIGYFGTFGQQVCVFFGGWGIGAIVVHLFSIVSLFICTRPNRSRVGAIDKLDRPEQAFDQYDIPEDPEKIFTNDFSIVGHEKMIIFGVFDDFISNFTYYDLY